MRKLNVALMAIAMTVVMFLTGCQSDNPVSGDDFDIIDGVPIFTDNLPSELIDNLNYGGLDNPFNEEYQDLTYETILSDSRTPATDRKREAIKRDRKKRDDRGERIGDDMKLTDEQKRAMAQARAAYLRCSQTAREIISEIHKTIFGAANGERQEIIAKLRAGELTREEALTQIKALRLRLMKELESNPELQRAMLSLKACQEQLRNDMNEILKKDQKDKIDNRRKDNDKKRDKDSDRDKDRDGDNDDDKDDDKDDDRDGDRDKDRDGDKRGDRDKKEDNNRRG